MERSYRQLSLEDRCEIARLSANGSSVQQIAAALDRPPSAISRELKRNRAQAGYRSGESGLFLTLNGPAQTRFRTVASSRAMLCC